MAEMTTSLPVFQFEQTSPGATGAVGAQGGGVRLGIAGGNSTSGVGRTANTQALGDANLPAFLAEQGGRKIAAVQQQKMYEGFTAAAMGATAREITESVPWYSRIFGSTPYQLGAQMFGVQKSAADLQRTFVENLDDLVEKSPDDMMKWVVEQGMNLQTGDLFTDAAMQKAFMERVPGMLDTYTKARVEYQQNQLVNQFVAARMAEGKAFNATMVDMARRGQDHADQETTLQQTLGHRVAHRNGWVKPEGMTDASYKKAAEVAMLSYAESGDLYSLNDMRNAGMLNMFNAEEREKLEGRIETARNRFVRNMEATNPELVRAMAMTEAEITMGMHSPADAVASLEEVNRVWRALTGDERGIYDMNDYVRSARTAAEVAARAREQQLQWELRQEERAQDRADRASERAANAAEAERLRQQEIASRINMAQASAMRGSLGEMVAQGVVKEDDAQQQLYAAWSAGPDGMGTIIRNATSRLPKVSSAVKAEIRQAMDLSANGQWTPAFEQSVALYNAMEEYRVPLSAPHNLENGPYNLENGPQGADDGGQAGIGAALMYFDSGHIDLIRRYRTNRQTMDEQTAYATAVRSHSNAPRGNGGLNKETIAAVDDVLSGPGFIARLFGAPEVPTGPHVGYLRQAIIERMPEIERMYPGHSLEQRVNAAKAAALAENVDVAGVHSWPRSPGQDPITSYADKASPDVYSAMLGNAITDARKAAGVGDSAVETIIRMPDQNGWPVLRVFSMDDEGRMFNMVFGEEEFRRVSEQSAQKDIENSRRSEITGQRVNDPRLGRF